MWVYNMSFHTEVPDRQNRTTISVVVEAENFDTAREAIKNFQRTYNGQLPPPVFDAETSTFRISLIGNSFLGRQVIDAK